ncbi:MAG: glycosyltransferase family 2 protein, partial [Parcubacteria group bacterium]|nr:glycosyltransferase family 2 protein [Parcubacteria group bacterium]
MKVPHIAIIVLHYKNLADTRACLKSLEKIDYPPIISPLVFRGGLKGGFSVIVVNNDAVEHGRTLKNEFSNITLIQNQSNAGFAEGNNVGIRHALADSQTDAVLILNNDTQVEPDFLNEMASELSPPYQGGDTEGVHMIAACMMQYDKRDTVDNLGVVMMKSGLPFNRIDEHQKLFCPSAGCALYSRKLLERVAYERNGEQYYFDRTYFAYAEDLDLGFRARLLGFEPAYAKDAVVYHKGSASSSKLSDLAVCNTYRNLIWTQYKNYPATLFLRNLFWLILGWKLIFLGYVFKGRPLVMIRAVFDGIRGLSTMKQK